MGFFAATFTQKSNLEDPVWTFFSIILWCGPEICSNILLCFHGKRKWRQNITKAGCGTREHITVRLLLDLKDLTSLELEFMVGQSVWMLESNAFQMSLNDLHRLTGQLEWDHLCLQLQSTQLAFIKQGQETIFQRQENQSAVWISSYYDNKRITHLKKKKKIYNFAKLDSNQFQKSHNKNNSELGGRQPDEARFHFQWRGSMCDIVPKIEKQYFQENRWELFFFPRSSECGRNNNKQLRGKKAVSVSLWHTIMSEGSICPTFEVKLLVSGLYH